MAISGIGSYGGVYQSTYAPQQRKNSPAQAAAQGAPAAGRDTVELSGSKGPEEKNAAKDESKKSGRVGINAARLARQLAAAKTRAQVQAVIAELKSDLKECESGKAQGMDLDEASYSAAQRLLQEAQQRMGQTENREATPEEEMASALASLF